MREDPMREVAAPPLPPSPMAGDRRREAAAEARLPWHTVAAACVAGAIGGGLFLVPLPRPSPGWPLSEMLQVASVLAAGAAVLAVLLAVADRLARPALRWLTWGLATALPGWGLAGWSVYESLDWTHASLALPFMLLGPTLALASRARRALPWLAAGGATLVAALAIPTLFLVQALARGRSASASDVAEAAAAGAVAFTPFGLAVGLCLYFERRRVEEGKR